MKVYITKYALSDGILEKDAEECDRFPGMIRTDDGAHFHGEDKDWTRTKEAAAARAAPPLATDSVSLSSTSSRSISVSR